MQRYLLIIGILMATACSTTGGVQSGGSGIERGLERTGEIIEDIGDDIKASLEGQDTTDRHEFVDDGTHYEYKRPGP